MWVCLKIGYPYIQWLVHHASSLLNINIFGLYRAPAHLDALLWHRAVGCMAILVPGRISKCVFLGWLDGWFPEILWFFRFNQWNSWKFMEIWFHDQEWFFKCKFLFGGLKRMGLDQCWTTECTDLPWLIHIRLPKRQWLELFTPCNSF